MSPLRSMTDREGENDFCNHSNIDLVSFSLFTVPLLSSTEIVEIILLHKSIPFTQSILLKCSIFFHDYKNFNSDGENKFTAR